MADERRLNALEIREIEGTTKWRAKLFGRSLPHLKEAPEFGVQPKGENTFYRGNPEGRSEPTTVNYPELSFSGRWDLLHFKTGDSRIEVYPKANPTTPQAACDFFEAFAARSKVVEVTWSGAATRIATWVEGEFTYKLGRYGVRQWHIKLPVIARTRTRTIVTVEAVTPRGSLAALQSAARKLDLALSDYPPGLTPSFLDLLKDRFADFRGAIAKVRQAVNDIAELADFTRAPIELIGELLSLGEAATSTCVEALEAFEETPYAYQSNNTRAESLFAARLYRERVTLATHQTLDQLIALFDYIESLGKGAKRYVDVAPGDSLARLALREYGAADLWTKIADANGLSSQTVPAGISSLVVPEI